MVSALAFGWADNTYPNLDYSGYHKNVIQLLFIIFTFKTCCWEGIIKWYLLMPHIFVTGTGCKYMYFMVPGFIRSHKKTCTYQQ